nr:histidine phosphatase family protein [Jiangella aurantiaca]
MTATRHLYLARHAEATPDEAGLTAAGRRQAELLGERLRDGGRPIDAVLHGPLPRAAETARIVAAILGVEPAETAAAGDYVPYVPQPDEVPEAYLRFVRQFDDHGPRLAAQAIERFTGPVRGDADRHELVVTHACRAGRRRSWCTTTPGTCPTSCAGPASRPTSRSRRAAAYGASRTATS